MGMIRFGRDLTPDEWRGYTHAVRQGKQALGIRKLGLILPVRSLPADKNDLGIGSPSRSKPFWNFVTRLGFDTVQIDPAGKTRLGDASPYTGTAFSRNPLYLDLTPLATEAWGNLLDVSALEEGRQRNPVQDGSRTAYKHAYQLYESLLAIAYANFVAKKADPDAWPAAEQAAIRQLDRKFNAFVQKNQAWLESDSLYEALARHYQEDNWQRWTGPDAELDKNLLNPQTPTQAKAAEKRIRDLKRLHQATIGAYQFAQFIIQEQKDAFNQYARSKKLDVVADLPVGLSDRDVWANQSLFLKGYALGCPPDYFSKDGQAWGFPVLDPEQLFNADGSLGKGGEYLKRLFEKTFQDAPGGVRIDHIIGLIDPWVYPANESSTKNGARLYSSPEHPVFNRYAKISKKQLNKNARPDQEERVNAAAVSDTVVQQYAKILEKIIIPVAQAQGVPLSSIICEDLGTLTNPVKKVLEKLALSGIRVTQFVDPRNPGDVYRGKNAQPQHWITPGTHDNEPTLVWSRKLVGKGGDDIRLHAENLAADLVPDSQARPGYAAQLIQNALALTQAKFVELFASPARHVQVFFTDWLGMETSYNAPGTVGEQNWSLRVPKQYKDAFFNALKSGKGLNLPEALGNALQANPALKTQHAALIQTLETYARILKE